MSAYSFLNVQASILGPGINATIVGTPNPGGAQIGSGAGSAKEGISHAFSEGKQTVTTGSDGSIMTSLHATQTGKITIRLLKTSPLNAVLNQAYNFQRSSAANWAQNVIRIVDKVRGDVLSGVQMGFEKHPDNMWGEDGNTLEWVFEGLTRELLGVGLPDVNTP